MDDWRKLPESKGGGLPRTSIAFPVLFLVALSLLAGCQHRVRIDTDPAGVRVSDLQRGSIGTTGSSPFEFVVDQGASLDLTFEKEGYVPQKRLLRDIRHDQQIFVELYRRGTVLAVVTQPPGAEVEFYDGEGRPLRFHNAADPGVDRNFANQRYLIPEGIRELDVELRKPGFETIRQRVALFQGRENRFSFELEEKFSHFSIHTVPGGARVTEKYLNYLGTTPIDGYEMPLSRMRHLYANRSLRDVRSVDLELEISKEGYRTERRVHRVDLYETNPTLEVHLEPIE